MSDSHSSQGCDWFYISPSSDQFSTLVGYDFLLFNLYLLETVKLMAVNWISSFKWNYKNYIHRSLSTLMLKMDILI